MSATRDHQRSEHHHSSLYCIKPDCINQDNLNREELQHVQELMRALCNEAKRRGKRKEDMGKEHVEDIYRNMKTHPLSKRYLPNLHFDTELKLNKPVLCMPGEDKTETAKVGISPYNPPSRVPEVKLQVFFF